MAELTAMRNNALGYPIYGMPYVLAFPILDEDGDPVTGLTPDSEISLNGDTGADTATEAAEIAFTTATNKGMYQLQLSAAEMTCDVAAITVYTGATTSQATCMVLYPKKLVKILSGIAGATGNDSSNIHIPDGVAINDFYNGCVIYLKDHTGSGQVRMISDFVASTKLASVSPAFATAPDDTTDYEVYMTEVAIASILALLTGAIPNAVAGAAGGLFIAGTNAAVTVTGATTLTGNVSLGGTLGVTGATTLASASVTGQFDAGNVLVDGTTVYTGAVTHKEDELYEKKLTITGATALTGAVTAPAGITANLTGNITGTLDTVTALTTKTGFALSATGADLILKNATFSLAIADAVWAEVSTLGGAYTFDKLATRIYQILNNAKAITEATGVLSLKALGPGTEIASGAVNSGAGITDSDELTWA
jgi:hypothetical protein